MVGRREAADEQPRRQQDPQVRHYTGPWTPSVTQLFFIADTIFLPFAAALFA